MRLLAPFDRALLIIDEIVFDVPAELEALRRAAGETRTITQAPAHLVEGDPEGFRRLLEGVLSDWVDFRVVFSPSRHALRADHDEFTTFFSMSRGRIAAVREALAGEVAIFDDWSARPL